jgi:hypothetical protein
MKSKRLLDKTAARGLATPKGLSRSVAMLSMAVALAAGAALAQEASPKAEHPGAGHGGMMRGGDKGDMMSMHAQMMTDMKAMDARLDQKLAAMNEAKDKNKVEAMAAVINEMAAQRKETMAKMSTMHDQMMMHMGGQMGAGEGTAHGAADHSEHQEEQK